MGGICLTRVRKKIIVEATRVLVESVCLLSFCLCHGIFYIRAAKMLACSGGDYVESKKLLELLNSGIALELNLSIKYMWQRVLVKGIEGAVVENLFKDIANTKMKHAEKLAERLAFLDGVPPNNIESVHVGVTFVEMVKEDVQAEEEAISLFKQAIQVAGKEGDFGTKRLLEDILIAEEKHLDKFSKLLVGMTSPFTQP